jgi:broad specificity phosphatase PhoE
LAAEADTELREVDFGDWEGLSFVQISILDADGVSRWDRWDPHFAFPGGERLRDFLGRVDRVAQRLASVRTENVVVFTHGGVVRSLICHYLGLDSRKYLLFDVAPASVTTIRLFDGRGVLARLNDCCHLKGD